MGLVRLCACRDDYLLRQRPCAAGYVGVAAEVVTPAAADGGCHCANPNDRGIERNENIMSRYLPEVIDEIVAVLPDEEASLRSALLSVRQSAIYAPPELQTERWWQAAMVLDSRAKAFSVDERPAWIDATKEIFNGRTDSPNGAKP